ncbi:MAG: tRNA (N(6)-L-threonylcarbamoyladenosine(37)-C(2))-methylthiotransferase [Candidatus Nanoarchaeia archaeon]|jgi:MiaB-like tRNA modifying enzyme
MAKIKLIAFGCSNNQAESEIMAGLLRDAGHEIVDSKEDIAIIGICNVKGPSFNKGIKAAKEAKGKVILAGCIPDYQLMKIRKEFPKASIVSTHNIAQICSAVEGLKKEKRIELVEKKNTTKLLMPRARINSTTGIIPISTGCMGDCAYCSVKAIKGQLVSYPIEDILKEARQCIKENCKEIWITAQDTGCYGIDIGKTLPQLLNEIIKLDGDFKIRLGMANPQFVAKYLKEIIEIMNNPKMFCFLHIPIQAGSDKILKDMNRKYTSKEFVDIITKLKKEVRDICIATDIIVGYPTETEDDFLESMRIIEEIKPDVLYINRFWQMLNTKAASLKQLRSEILKERSLRMFKLFRPMALENNKKEIGKEMEILIDEKAKGSLWGGRNSSYRLVSIKGKYKLGERIKVKIKSATSNYLVGEEI